MYMHIIYINIFYCEVVFVFDKGKCDLLKFGGFEKSRFEKRGV